MSPSNLYFIAALFKLYFLTNLSVHPLLALNLSLNREKANAFSLIYDLDTFLPVSMMVYRIHLFNLSSIKLSSYLRPPPFFLTPPVRSHLRRFFIGISNY